MKAFLLAAGYGERLGGITGIMPKPLVPVLNIPSICYSIMLLKEAGVSGVVCNLHYRHRQIIEFFAAHDNFGLDIVFSYEEKILGTGGGLMNCREHFEDEPFVYINSDIISDLDLVALALSYDPSRDGGVLALSGSGPGPVSVQGNRIVDLRNMLASTAAPFHDFLGAALLSPEIFSHLHSGYSDIVDSGLIELVRQGRLGFMEHGGPWHDIGSPESYRMANIGLIDRGNPFAERILGATGLVSEPVSRDAIVGAGAAIVRSVVGAGCVVGEGALVEDSVLLPGARVEPNSKVVSRVVL